KLPFVFYSLVRRLHHPPLHSLLRSRTVNIPRQSRGPYYLSRSKRLKGKSAIHLARVLCGVAARPRTPVSRSKRHCGVANAAPMPLATFRWLLRGPGSVDPAVCPLAFVAGCRRGSPPHPFPPLTQSTLAPRSAARQNFVDALRNEPDHLGHRVFRRDRD